MMPADDHLLKAEDVQSVRCFLSRDMSQVKVPYDSIDNTPMPGEHEIGPWFNCIEYALRYAAIKCVKKHLNYWPFGDHQTWGFLSLIDCRFKGSAVQLSESDILITFHDWEAC